MSDMLLLNLVAEHAKGLGLKVDYFTVPKYRRGTHRFLLIENRVCQVVPTRRVKTNSDYPHSIAIQLYLPRNKFPDFVIHVLRSENETVFTSYQVGTSRRTRR